ncbi:MAG TPA: M56 family metallopeptidase [Longimicrobiaceae bacterium]|nr:M56 family metallopeptidase [Longimicrobiaceae bacterium]
MTAAWALQALLAGALLGTGALAAERVAGWAGLPRRAAWAAAMAGSLLLPMLALWAPGLLPDLGIVPAARGAAAALDGAAAPWLAGGPYATPAAAPGAWWTDLPGVLGIGWVALSLATTAVLAWSWMRLRAARDRCATAEIDGIEVRVADRTGPAVVGLLHPAIVVPRWALGLPPEERRLVVLHEREHVAAGDHWLLLLGAAAVAAMPWSLPLWLQHRRLRTAVETDCDARVLARGASPRSYGRVLIGTAGRAPLLPFPALSWSGSTSQLEHRIMSMTASRPSHLLLRATPLLAAAAGLAAAACDVAGRTGPGTPPTLATAPAGAERAAVDTVRAPSKSTAPPAELIEVPPGDPSLGDPGFGAWFGIPFRILDGDDPARARTSHHPEAVRVGLGTGAWAAGLRDGDVILAVNGVDARRLGALKEVFEQRPGTPYVLRVRRDGREHEVRAEVGPPDAR